MKRIFAVAFAVMLMLPTMSPAALGKGGHASSHSSMHVTHVSSYGSYSSSSSRSYSSSSSSYSSGSRSYSSGGSSWGSYSKPSSSYTSSYSKPGSSYGSYSKPSTSSSTLSYSAPKSSTSTFNRSGTMAVSTSNYKAMKSYSSQYSKPASTVNPTVYHSSTYTSFSSSYGGNANRYYQARQTQLHSWQNRYPEPVYVYHMHPNYGIWDTYFLYLLLMNASQPSYAQWAYAHQNDPSYIEWHNDMQQQAATNTQIQQQLNTLNQQVATLQATKATPESPNVLPNGVSPAVAMSPTVVADDPNMQVGTDWWALLGKLFVWGIMLSVMVFIIKFMFFQNKMKGNVRW